MYSITARRMISGLVLKYLNGQCFIIRRGYETARPVSSSFCLTIPFCHMLARHAAKTCGSVAELVATAQNLGHTDVLTTLRSYGQISREDQRRLITGHVDEA